MKKSTKGAGYGFRSCYRRAVVGDVCRQHAPAQWHSDDSCPKCLGNPCECSRKETQS